MRNSWLLSEAWKACAAPWKLVMMLSGMPMPASACWMASTAAPSDAPGARLNDTVVAGNWPIWVICSGAVSTRMLATTESGIGAPPVELGR